MLLCPGTAKTDTHTPKMNRSESERKRKDTPEWHLIFMWFKHNSKGIAVVFPAFRMSSPLFGWFSGCVKMLSLSLYLVVLPFFEHCLFDTLTLNIACALLAIVFLYGDRIYYGLQKATKKKQIRMLSVCHCMLLAPIIFMEDTRLRSVVYSLNGRAKRKKNNII